MQQRELLNRIFDHIEIGDVDKSVRACLRLSRQIGDHMNTAFFLHELLDDNKEIVRTILDDTNHLKQESQKYIYEKSKERWIKHRTLPFGLSEDKRTGEKLNVLTSSIGELPSNIDQLERSISELAIPPGMGEFDSAAFTDMYNNARSQMRLKINALNIVKSRSLNTCFTFATQVELQLRAQEKSVSFLEQAQNEVQNYFKTHSDDVYEKLQKANQLIDSDSAEDHSLLLTQVRRAIKSVADYFYPPESESKRCADGTDRILGDEQYINRLYEYVFTKFPKSTSTELLRAETKYLLVFAQRLNDVASKGVHSEVNTREARQGFLGLYLFLYNICQRLNHHDT